MVNNRIFAISTPIQFLQIILFVHLCPLGMTDSALSITKAFTENDIVPDVLQNGPQKLAEVKFTDGHEAELGNLLTPEQTKGPPNVDWGDSLQQEGHFYTIAMVDPDAPSRANPVNSEWLHWLVVNIRGGEIDKGKVLTEYQGPSPPSRSGPHRYLVLVYQQEAELQIEPVKKRAKWSIEQFSREHNLGNPIAGNFFISQNPTP